MRIVSEWNHKDIKVTAFHMNGRYSIKLETNLLEQWYKFRDGQIESVEQLKKLLDGTFYDSVEKGFKSMTDQRDALFEKLLNELDFDEII